MRKREDYTRLVVVALLLSVGILIAFEVYILREPGRISTVLAADQAAHVAGGEKLFSDNCTTCHGEEGQGTKNTPALNSQDLLSKFDDNWFRQTIASGRPAKSTPTTAPATSAPTAAPTAATSGGGVLPNCGKPNCSATVPGK